MRIACCLLLAAALTAGCGDAPAPGTGTAAAVLDAEIPAGVDNKEAGTVDKLERSDAEWRKILTPEQYYILREKGTERAGTGDFLHTTDDGVYKCAGCGLALFRSDGKFDSGCGWPSFFEPLEGARITETRDTTHGMVRTEITCSRCGGHLGHVFTDGPDPTGLRYCVNSVSIDFEKKPKKGE